MAFTHKMQTSQADSVLLQLSCEIEMHEVKVSKDKVALLAVQLDEHIHVRQRLYDHENMLLKAARNGQVDVVRTLLEQGTHPDGDEKRCERTPLSFAAQYGHSETVRVLLEYGASFTPLDTRLQQYPIHYAASKGHLETTRILLGHSNATFSSRDAGVLLDMAASSENREIIELVFRFFRVFDTSVPQYEDGLFSVAERGYSEATKQFLHHCGVDLRERKCLDTALLLASQGGFDLVAKLLIDHGANINAQDERGWTALHFAARCGHKQLAKLLLNDKADHRLCDTDGSTALDVAIRGHRPGIDDVDVLELLLQHGPSFRRRTTTEPLLQ